CKARPVTSALCPGASRSGATGTVAVTTGALRFDEGEADRLGLGNTEGEAVEVAGVGSTVPVGAGDIVEVADPSGMACASSLAPPSVATTACRTVQGTHLAAIVMCSSE